MRENVETARLIMEAFNRGDRDAWFLLHHPELEFRADPKWPESVTLRGREAAWDFVSKLNEAWEPSPFEMVEAIDAGDDTLVARFRRPVQGKSSGIEDVFDYWVVSTFRNERVLTQGWFANRADALEAAGLAE